jgi:hypothetical protein
MKLSISIPTAHANRPLPASAYLADFKAIEFKNADLGLRHPVGIYNVSIQTVVEALKNAIDAAFAHRHAERGGDHEKECSRKLEQSLDHLLDATTEHFEDARSIVRVMFDDRGERAWKKALASFDSLVREARDFPARQANAIKHKQARIRLIRADAPDATIVGYFIDGVDAKGAVGPSPYVHIGNTAFSLGRTFRTLACGTYFLSRALLTILSGAPASPRKLAESGFGQLAPLFDQLVAMDTWIFWDEPDSCPAVIKRGETITIETQGQRHWIVPPPGTRINLILPGDGSTMSHRIPYMGDYLNPAVNAPGRTRKR